tara:strand:- start:8387 stop:9088 length:702 start_codon:yes stop_codon:yes gene_type:complete
MVFKYYHGTSTIFLDSIRKYGLGAINPNTDQKNLEVLKFLFELSENHLKLNPEYITLKNSTWAMVNQGTEELTDERGNKVVLHFRHDGMYVSITRIRAAIYAVLNKYGSEILERCIELYKLLINSNIPVKIPPEIDLFDFRQYIDAETKPIMIEVLGISDNDLEKEDGKTASDALNLLRRCIPKLTEKEQFEFLQYCNFKLLKPVPVKQLNFFEIEYEGHPENGDFKFLLSRI